jgi:hypothetical protein
VAPQVEVARKKRKVEAKSLVDKSRFKLYKSAHVKFSVF